jgi:hypothetical protein
VSSFKNNLFGAKQIDMNVSLCTKYVYTIMINIGDRMKPL